MTPFAISAAGAAVIAVANADVRSLRSALSTTPSPSSVVQQMAFANAYFTSNNGIGNCDWERGTYYDGATAYYGVSKDADALTFINAWATNNSYTCSDGKPSYDYDANKQCSGHAYARLYEMAPADHKLAMGVTLEKQAAATQVRNRCELQHPTRN
jgi:rhamnogalacturonyl hydrolase YesR